MTRRTAGHATTVVGRPGLRRPARTWSRADAVYATTAALVLTAAVAAFVLVSPRWALAVQSRAADGPTVQALLRLPGSFSLTPLDDVATSAGSEAAEVAAAAAGGSVLDGASEPWVVVTASPAGTPGGSLVDLLGPSVPVDVEEATASTVDGRPVRVTPMRYVDAAGVPVAAVEYRTASEGVLVTVVAGCARGCFAARADFFDDIPASLELYL